MTLADRIVLMRDGLIEQQGAPLDLFERPASTFVAGFLGSPRMSFLPGMLVRTTDSCAIRLGETTMPLPAGRRLGDAAHGQAILLGLRPEHLTRGHGAEPPPGHVRHDATIELIQPTGSRSYATFSLAGSPVMAELQAHDVSRPGEHIRRDINMMRASVFDHETERAL
jgi:multiple sugar transport system ATP-binding protein